MVGAGPARRHYLNVGADGMASLLSCPLNITTTDPS